jgi:hypothetical protein
MTEFETHLTIALPPSASADRLRTWAAERGVKFTHIVLDRGATPSQPMLTRHGRDTLGAVVATAHRDAAELASAGFEVSRTKIEVAAEDALAPATDAASVDQPHDRYFEAHIKVLLATDGDVARLTTLAAAHAGQVSRNARRVRDDGRHERFVTQRGHHVGRATAARNLDGLLAALSVANVTVLDVEQEFVVHDSNLGVDAGWM